MSLEVTLIALAISVGIFLFASWRGKQPADPLKPRMVPWRIVIVISGFISVLLMVHLVTVLGLKQDQPY